MVEVQGSCDTRFAGVQDALAESLAGEDVGASAAVYLDGEPVGWANSHRYNERAAYDTTVLSSIYLAPDVRGRGLGRPESTD